MSRPDFDVVVVGGRVAGAATAMLLARRGARVLVVERSRRGSDTLSTHALLRPGVVQMRRWGLLAALDATGTPAITTSTFHYTPMRTDRAARDIRKKKTEYISDAAQRQKIGQIEDAQQTAEYQDVLQQEADLTAGHGVLRATGFVAVSASDPDELERAVAAIEQAAIQTSCETRRLWGQQAQGFAVAALPLARGV